MPVLRARLKQTFNQVFEKVVVINLVRRTDRLENITQQLNSHGITFERFEAVDGLAEGIGAAQACAASHRAVIEKYYDCKSIFIFEDDAFLHPEFNVVFEAIIKDIPQDWQMIYLGCNIQESQPINDTVARLIGGVALHAYGIKKDIFDDLIRLSYINEPVDVAYMQLNRSIPTYVAKPTIVNQVPGFSDIENSVKDYTEILR